MGWELIKTRSRNLYIKKSSWMGHKLVCDLRVSHKHSNKVRVPDMRCPLGHAFLAQSQGGG